MAAERATATTAPPISPSQVLLGLTVGRQVMATQPAPDGERAHVGADGRHDRAQEEGDAVAVRELARRQQQGRERAQEAHPHEAEQRAGHAFDRRSPVDPDQMPHH